VRVAPVRVIAGLILRPGTAASQGEPLLDPRGWTARHRWFTLVGLLVAAAAGLAEAIQRGSRTGGAEGLRAFVAALIGVALIGLALSLRGITVPGFLLGGLFVAAGVLSWTYTSTGAVVWAVLAVEAVIFTVWTFPWLRDLARLPRLGTAWLGLAYWFLGTVGALLVGRLGVAGVRFGYAAVFTVGALAVVTATRAARRDLSVGIVAAFLVALGAVFLAGAGNALDDVHAVPDNAWGAHQQYRFWGGPYLLYHPNSIAVVAVTITVRIAADRAFERWQRYAALGVSTIVLLLVNSRTGWAYFAAATVLWAVLVGYSRRWRRPVEGLDSYPTARAAWAGALLPVLLAVVIGLASGGAGFLGTQRYGDMGGVTSGRSATWGEVWREFKADDVPQKIFGDARFARGYVIRDDTGDARSRPKLTTDNALVGSLRRGGILGVVTFLVGLVLLLWHAIAGVRRGTGRRGPPAWFTLAAVGSVITIATSDWLLGGTGGTLWIYLSAGEAFLLFGPVQTPLTSVDGGPDDGEVAARRAAART
jgi:hypothetical protein